MKILLPKYIRIPTGDGLKVIIEGFKDKLGFPQCVGVVDGTHIPIVSRVSRWLLQSEGVALHHNA